MADCNRNQDFYASQELEGSSMNKKYGGLVPKKKPLISKDHERAFFDSADWALCKVIVINAPHEMFPSQLSCWPVYGAYPDLVLKYGTARSRSESKIYSGNRNIATKITENTSPATASQKTRLYIWYS